MDNEPGSLAHHLEWLIADAEDLKALLNADHSDGGDIHPEALPKAERLHSGLSEVLHALTHHEHLEPLAVDADDVWAMLTRKHTETELHPDEK